MARRKGLFEGLKPVREQCRNPWNGGCENTDIQVYIIYRGEKLPICSRCWGEICESDVEWGGGSSGSEGLVKGAGECMQ
jgi:hypothetical protein